ncbi:MAG: molybdenum cofactor guanylyltransferase [Solirubrobacterales bacterium]
MADHESEIRAAILAGGSGSRLGGEKAEASLAGRPLITYPLEATLAAGLAPFVVAKPDSALPPLDCQVVREPERPTHPLVGAITALGEAPRGVLLLGCDMPFLTAELLRWLASLAPPAMASVGGRLEPLLGIYDEGAIDPFSAALATEGSLRGAVESLGPRRIDEEELARFGDPERLVFSVNTQDDLIIAERLL